AALARALLPDGRPGVFRRQTVKGGTNGEQFELLQNVTELRPGVEQMRPGGKNQRTGGGHRDAIENLVREAFKSLEGDKSQTEGNEGGAARDSGHPPGLREKWFAKSIVEFPGEIVDFVEARMPVPRRYRQLRPALGHEEQPLKMHPAPAEEDRQQQHEGHDGRKPAAQ